MRCSFENYLIFRSYELVSRELQELTTRLSPPTKKIRGKSRSDSTKGRFQPMGALNPFFPIFPSFLQNQKREIHSQTAKKTVEVKEGDSNHKKKKKKEKKKKKKLLLPGINGRMTKCPPC
eukprot:TRINITY_DN899_c8_g1_i1.p1 TRINITY_DN899_c8_g1~~TRINITY_DN899_c8_g1_i1.p1  ORF type:complete len:120 (-),score=6.29 TRINITY_DN899_c8_g1_i1:286-645(-)